MPEMAFMLLLVIALISFSNWRYGFALCVLTALSQDPMRKLTVGQPVYFVVFVGATFGAAWIGALMASVPLFPRRISGWQKHVGVPFTLFVVLAILQAAHSLLSYGSPMLTAIGMLSYFSPIPAIVLAYQFAVRRGQVGIARWMRFYVVCASLALISVYLEFIGFNWRILGEVGTGVLISGAGEMYKGNAGIFRAAEIAAWHAATAASFSFMLLWGRRFSLPKVLLALGLIVFFVGLGTLTGRRKMIIEVSIFICTYVCLVVWFRHRAGKMAIFIAILGLVTYLGTVGMVAPGPGEHDPGVVQGSRMPETGFIKYSNRAKTVFADIPARLNGLGLQPVTWAVDQYGWMGAGLGVGSQGGQHFGVATSAASEGGLGKLTVELGLPGLALVGWLVVAFALYVWGLLGPLANTSPKLANLAFGFVAFILANAAAFSVATQAYGDIFILLTLGWALGFLLALPVLAKNEKEKQQLARQEARIGGNVVGAPRGGDIATAYRSRLIRDRQLPPR